MSDRVRFRPLALDGDLDLVHGWMQQDHVAPWWNLRGPRDASERYLRAELARDHVRSWVVEADGAPVGFVQSYRVADDPLAAAYAAGPDDRGWHVLLGERERLGDGTARRLGRDLLCGLLAEPGVAQAVCEPDERNGRMRRFCAALGGEEAGRFPFDGKPAVLVRWTRRAVAERWPRALAAAEAAGRRWDALGEGTR
ncbi:GNAT family N-acetyltransferase [Patulibacter defluvii]|uniref:GNAT family N-acetyltransferase n=1 Tax=Patulibacter defluvii TaxID=3095358 RepID=UPI002A75F2D4|nr:GNAT family N-acetyltransferase [Patulibacter sp. DM4]